MTNARPITLAVATAIALAIAGCATAPKPVAVAQAPALPTSFNEKLPADALFASGKSSLADLSEQGRAQLDALASRLNSGKPIEVVRVIGFSDRIGKDKANIALSTKRAQAVRAYLVQQGVPADTITATGWGNADPVVTCTDKDRAALTACLAPNRRVEIRVIGAR